MAQPVFLYLRVFASCRDFALRRDLPWQVRVRVFRRATARPYVRGFSAGHDDGSPSLVFLGRCLPHEIMGLSTTAHPPGAYADFHVGTSPYVGTCRGKSGLGFMVWSLDESLSCFQTCYSTSVRSGFSAGHDDGSPSLVFLGAMSTP